MQEHRHSHYVRDFRSVVLGIVEAVGIDAFLRDAADFDRYGGIAAVDDGHHLSRFAAVQQIGGEAAGGVGYELVGGGGGAGAPWGGGGLGGGFFVRAGLVGSADQA